MKKIIVGIFALFMVFTTNSAFAAPIWNTDVDDCPLPLSVGNASTGNGINVNGCWNLTSVSANPGQTISVAVYYDNTSGVTQNNVHVILNQNTSGTASTHTFSGSIVSDQGTYPLGSVSVNLTSPAALNFSSTKWFTNNQGQIPSPLLGGQSGSEVINGGGLNIGSIVTTTPTSPTLIGQGSVIVNFTVGNSTPVNNCTISNFTANGSSSTTVSSGQPVTLAWNTNNCTSVSVTGPSMTSSNLSGSQTIYPTYSGTYMISAYGSNGTQTQTVYVNVNSTPINNCYINSFTANGSTNAYVSANDPVTLNWSTSNCTSVTVTGPSMSSYNLSGSQTIYPTYSGTYTINAYGYNGGNQTQTVYINVNNNQNSCYISRFTVNGSSTANITSGQPVTLSWITNNCTSVSINGVGSNLPSSSSQVVYPTTNTTYIINAYGYNSGNQSQSVYVNVNGNILPPVYNSCAVTTVATNITKTSAQLNGMISNNGQSSNSYFEYGTTVSMGSRTPSRYVSGAYFDTITGLAADTIYYFRSVSDCNGGLSYGKIEIFATDANAVVNPRPVIIQGTTVIGTQSPIMLKIEDRYQAIGIGDMVDYTVTYKNIGKSVLRDPVLQVVVPRGITLTNASGGTYSSDTNTLTVPLNDLRPGQDGVIYLQGRVDSLSSNTAQIVTTAILVYTNPNGAQENAIAYVLNTPKDFVNGNVLGASAFWGGLASLGLVGWLLLIIIILMIILIARRYSGSKSVVQTTTPTGTHTTTTHY